MFGFLYVIKICLEYKNEIRLIFVNKGWENLCLFVRKKMVFDGVVRMDERMKIIEMWGLRIGESILIRN